MIFFTADTHWGHTKILEYQDRPFANTHEMDEAMITNWNSVVSRGDIVYHLGDVGLCAPAKLNNILRRLNGQIHLIKGNHDKTAMKCQEHFAHISDLKHIKVKDPDARRGTQIIVLCHYAMRTWHKSHWGSWQLYGHSHGNLPELPNILNFDVGVDCWNFTPVSYEQVKSRMAKKGKPAILDHHGA